MLGTSNKLVPEVAFDFGTNFLWLYQKTLSTALKRIPLSTDKQNNSGSPNLLNTFIEYASD
jgi:hypothetical protein